MTTRGHSPQLPLARDAEGRAAARPLPTRRWPAGEIATLTRLVETLVPVEPPEAAAIAQGSAERLDRNLDPSLVRALRVVLRLLEAPVVGALFGGSARPFSRLSPAARERELRRWATSRFEWRRISFQAFKRLIAHRAYADPAPAGRPNPLRAGLGYDPPVQTTASVVTVIVPYELPPARSVAGASPRAHRSRDEPVELEADVVIVGSGAGGGVVARELALAGRDVLVLDAGPLALEPAMPASEALAYDRLFLDGGMTATWNGSMTMVAGSCVGGGTTVNWASCLPPPASVRQEWARDHGLSWFDGPEVDTDFDALRRDLGLAPPPNLPPKDRVILDGAAALGIEAGPLVRNAVACGDCGSCGFGCRLGAKRSTLRVHLADAWAAGARILPDATVRRVTLERGRATGVEAEVRTGSQVRSVRVRARQVVVAAGGLRTPGILERSGVGHPAVGRYLRLHPVSLVAGLFDAPIEMWRGTMQAAHSMAWAPGSPRAVAGRHAGFVIESVPGHLSLLAVAFPWRSSSEFGALMRRAPFVAPIIAITRDGGWGTVRQTRAGRARIDYPLRGTTARTLRAALLASAEIARAGGASAILAPGEPGAWYVRQGAKIPGVQLPAIAGDWGSFVSRLGTTDFAAGRSVVLSAHQLGSARMGADPSDHPVDPDGRVRKPPSGPVSDRPIHGLYVADGSLFPTGLGVNPMITIMLLARRIARTILDEGAPSSRSN